jgi:hypothetical protein
MLPNPLTQHGSFFLAAASHRLDGVLQPPEQTPSPRLRHSVVTLFTPQTDGRLGGGRRP